MARTQNIAPFQAYGCDKSIAIQPGDGPSLIWANRNEITYHELTQTQFLYFPVRINLSKKALTLPVTSEVDLVDDFPSYDFLLPLVRVYVGRHFEVLNTEVTLQGMDLREAFLLSQPEFYLSSDDSPPKEKVQRRTGGASTLTIGAILNADHIRFSYNQLGNSMVCAYWTNYDNLQAPTTLVPEGTAVKAIESTLNFSDVSFDNNALLYSKLCGSEHSFATIPRNNFAVGTIYAENSNVNIHRARFHDNHADYGSAIAFRAEGQQRLTMEEVEIRHNYPTPALSEAPEYSLIGEDLRFIRTAIDMVGGVGDFSFLSIRENMSAGISAYKSQVKLTQSAIYKNALHAVINQNSNFATENVLIHGNLQRRRSLYEFNSDLGSQLVCYRFKPDGRYNNISMDDCGGSTPGENAVVTLNDPNEATKASTVLTHATVSDNFGEHAILSGQGTVTMLQGTVLLHEDSPATCSLSNIQDASLGANLDNNLDNTCGLTSTEIGLIPNLLGIAYQSNVGPTGFLTMPINKPAPYSVFGNSKPNPVLNNEKLCSVKVDQIETLRPLKGCDSGSIEIIK